ncbi:DUF4191 domain-containing protein [Aurantimicrobium sp. MWH-Uga1]|uniref:DUF4191 domain-containing protein n=1 Tax=Aurantimicrobium sp. MWH-Uga1 TaxID=2079575 RepID=UPI000DED74EF|nr:DUF4191 domain-containing protein [Aurantimicrobium sp. MWH-Uga1]AXE54609.1 hypothetical protein AURUGA1_00923 [Aurantimicrobium sp. MWH-Uga1]
MARTKKPKGPSRIKQMWQVFQMTRRYDKSVVPLILLAFFAPTAIGTGAGIALSNGNIFILVLWILIGVMTGVLVGMIVLGRRAERAAYSQIEGQPGAVGAVLKSAQRRSWIGEETPVAINPKTKDAIYRAVGRGGVVLIAEGPIARTQRLVDDERRKTAKVLPNVPITVLTVGPDETSVKLYKLGWQMTKIKHALTKNEVRIVANRLSSLGTNVPIPKGIDPFKVRPSRAR